jgi:hypothetical protein
MRKFTEWLGDRSASDIYGDVEMVKRTCRSFGLDWRVEGGDLLVGSTFRPGADNVGMEIARQATLVLQEVPGGEIEPVGRGYDNRALIRLVMGVKEGKIYVRKVGVEPSFLELLKS